FDEISGGARRAPSKSTGRSRTTAHARPGRFRERSGTSARQHLLLRRGGQALALRLLARGLACTTHRLGLFPRRSFRRLFVKPSLLHFPEDAFTLHLLLQNSESLVDVVVAYENLQRMFI